MGEPSLSAACEARIGRVLNGKWTLEKLLGLGGMAAVYVAAHKIGRREAIKILHPEVARSPELRARFAQEAHAVNRFAHPGTVEIRDSDISEDGCPFLVMELLEGENLAQRAGRLGGLSPEELLRYVDELLDVLAAAHAQGIIHRDIKLDNLFVTNDGKLKVLDFGIARVVSGPVLTRVGARLGTTAYMAPEQVRGEEVDGRTDLFAVGATMFRVLAKRRLHEAESEADLLLKMGREAAPSLASVVPGVDRGLALVVDRALAFDREHRYPNALTMQGDVRALIQKEEPPFASARARLATNPTRVGGAAPAAVLAAASEPTRAEGAGFTSEPTAAAAPAADPMSMRAPAYMPAPASMPAPVSITAPQASPVVQRGRTVAIATPPPGSMISPFSSAPPFSTPAPPSAAPSATPPPASAWPAASVASVPPLSGPVSAGYPSASPITPQAFATPAPATTKRGGLGIALALIGLVALGVVGAGGFFLLRSAPAQTSAASEDEDDDDDEDASTKKRKPSDKAKTSAAGEAPKPAAAPAPAATASAKEKTEEKADKAEKPEPEPVEEEKPQPAPKPTSSAKPGSSQRPASPGTGFEPAPSGKPKKPKVTLPK